MLTLLIAWAVSSALVFVVLMAHAHWRATWRRSAGLFRAVTLGVLLALIGASWPVVAAVALLLGAVRAVHAGGTSS